MMHVLLTFDVEVWCDGWDDLDRKFGPSFDRYVYGRSRHGDFALPQTLSILNQHGLKGVFFVEPLFAARFGTPFLETIVRLIRDAGQEIQLHLHPEWADEAVQPIIPDHTRKRQHLTHYTLQEQARLIGFGRDMLEAAGSGPITAFRSGSYAANDDTYRALQRIGILLDSSLNSCYEISGPGLRPSMAGNLPFEVHGVTTFPITVFRDGFGRDRPAQLGACGTRELNQALNSAYANDLRHFVIVSHNFEMLRPGSSLPDLLVVRRFERLCAYLAGHADRFRVAGFHDTSLPTAVKGELRTQARAHWMATGMRHLEQARRRIGS